MLSCLGRLSTSVNRSNFNAIVFGNPQKASMLYDFRTLKRRFWWFLKFVTVEPGGCWRWNGPRFNSRQDYGAVRILRHQVPAHRFAYELMVGPVPARQLVRHSCDTQDCVFPAHLVPGTHKDNMRDMVVRGRSAHLYGETHGMAKLTNKDVRAIRAAGGTYKDIAKRFGVSPTLIGLIKRRRNWKHVV
jgi:hypothetical protein